jgi:hypothetical protein
MKRFLWILILLAIPYMVFAGTEERVSPPQDQAAWYVSVFGDPADSKFQQLKGWFKTHEGLKSLRDQVHYNEYSSDQLRFKRYADSLPGLPCVRMQNERGQVKSEFWADNIPITSDGLYKAMRADLQNKAEGCLFGKRRRRGCPTPSPTPPVAPPVAPPPATPPVGPPVLPPDPVEPEPEKFGFPWILAVLSILSGAGIGLAQGYRKEREDSAAPGVNKL